MPATAPIRIVTTSWDDGDVRDLRIAEMLRSHGLRGTFYCPIEPFNGNPSLTTGHKRSLVSDGMEIGGHGVAHEIMSEISREKTARVVTACKAQLENELGEPIRMFCYPRGKFTAATVAELRKAGYQGARTVRLLATETGYDQFDLPTSIQVYPHTRSEYLRNTIKSGKLGRVYDYVAQHGLGEDWVEIGARLFDRVMERGGIWHLWGHSWEIDELQQWDAMARMLQYVAHRPGVLYLTNGDLLPYLPGYQSVN
jgi:peptidoglycan/xylan/chitin deacetylase (PgdA/CDA1 family)